MPSGTFCNLSSEKRERIIQKCYVEFSQNSFREASVSKIVSDLGIAKGSIYKYFNDKQDLYFYLIDRAAEAKLTSIAKAAEEAQDVLWKIMKAGAVFDLENPLITGFLHRVFSDSHTFEPDIRTQLISRSCDFLMSYLKDAQERGGIRRDIDARLVSLFVNTVLTGAGTMLASLNGGVPDAFLADAQASKQKRDALFAGLADIYKLLMQGIAG
jgi:AcrR family transcriptional regulator